MKNRGFIVWVVLGAVLLTVLNLPLSVSVQSKAALREGIAPLQGLVTRSVQRTGEAWYAVRGLGGMVEENRKLAEELLELRNEVRGLKRLENENRALRTQLNYVERSSRELMSCEVFGRDISGWWQTIRVDKGSSSDVARNTAVVTAEGLVGKVIDVSTRTSDVLLISDPTCKVSSKLTRTGAFGVVSGTGVSWRGDFVCQFKFIKKDVSVREGDEVVTSGLSSVFPKNILIGYVEDVVIDKTGLYQTATVIPAADLGKMDYVFLVTVKNDPIKEHLRKKGLTGRETR